jgi:hypothetical protein
VCDADGHWDVEMPRCYDDCMAEPVVQDGFVNCTGTEHNDECSYALMAVKRLGYRMRRI